VNPRPQVLHNIQNLWKTCGSGQAREGVDAESALVAALLLGLLVVRHQAALLIDLAVGEGVLLALVRVLTALVLDADRRTDQLQHRQAAGWQAANKAHQPKANIRDH